MELKDIISNTHKEIVGSRTKNRLTVQISYAIQLIMELYSTDYIVLMDYIEDVSVITNPDKPSNIHLYQIKTKSAGKQYKLSTVISEKWYQKLYANAKKYNSSLGSATVVCNTDIVNAGKEIFDNEKNSLKALENEDNIKKVRSAIAKNEGIKEMEVDLSKFYFIRSYLSVNGHKNETEHDFAEFLLNFDKDIQLATVKSIYSLIYGELDNKFNYEISDDCTDLHEIFDKKGLSSERIQSIISCGLAIQIPEFEKLLSKFEITSISQTKNLNKHYTKIKIDMYENITLFINFKKEILFLIDKDVQAGIDNPPQLLESVYSQAISSKIVPTGYQDEYYIKMLIMILIHRYCYGGEEI